MKGTVEPASSKATAAATCCGLTASSDARRDSIESIGRCAEYRLRGAHYAETPSPQQDLLKSARLGTPCARLAAPPPPAPPRPPTASAPRCRSVPPPPP